MAHSKFVHLRIHSAYSLLEGAIHVKELAKRCHDMDMPAAAITDTNNLFGALEFSEAAVNNGVQPIIGCQLSVQFTPHKLPMRYGSNTSQISSPMVFLAKNDAGYRNLLKMIAFAYLEVSDAHNPEVTLDILETYAEGLIVLTGGAMGPLGQMIREGQKQRAGEFLENLKEIFVDRLYIELQRHGTEEEQVTEDIFLEFAYELNIPLVATNEVYFLERDMHEAHDALICIAEGKYVSQQERSRKTPDHYLKRPEEMQELFKDLPEAVDNTIVIAQRCAFMVENIDK